MNYFLHNDFIFDPRYRLWRHLFYWTFHILIWAAFWVIMGPPLSYGRYVFNMILWVPAFIFFSYPLVYGAIPHLLLRGKIVEFFLVILVWGAVGLYIDVAYRHYVLIPIQEAMGLKNIISRGPLAFCYLCMTTSAASPMIIKFFKLWTIKQREWMQVQEEKVTAELQLLKAQVHPHFLFNTLNNIYSFSLENSPKTPGLILKLSSLLSYMLYECKAEEVRLEKEVEIMKNYIDLERERYDNKIEISWSIEGEINDKFIAPLLLLPFLENAFKHGLSEQIDKPWLGIDISVKKNVLYCKIVNSANEVVQRNKNGIGIDNVKKRLNLLYHGKHELKITHDEQLFVISMMLVVSEAIPATSLVYSPMGASQNIKHETSLPAYR